MIERSILKSNAKNQLRGNWWIAIAAFLISEVICGIISFIGSITEAEDIQAIGGIVALIISGPMCYGICKFILNIVRGENASISDIFSGFDGKVIIKSFVIMILTTIITSIGYLILIVPGIILSIMFSQSFFILVDNNELSAIDCMKLSCKIIRGNKMYLFKIYLSFLGWFILGILTLGIAFLWINPYFSNVLGNFYEELKEGSNIISD